MKRPPLLLVIAILALAGIVISSVSLVNHYRRSATEYCDLDDTFNCDLVNRSIYSKVLGVPVALIGLIGYGLLLGLSRVPAENRKAALMLTAGALLGLAFSLYLTYVEAFVLATWCILCLGSLGIILTITVLSGIRLFRKPA